MSTLLEQWRDTAYSKEMDKASLQKFWGTYFQTEKEIYEKLLENPDEEEKGTEQIQVRRSQLAIFNGVVYNEEYKKRNRRKCMIRVLVADDEEKVCQLICKLIHWEALNATLQKVRQRYMEHQALTEKNLEQKKQQVLDQARVRETLWMDLEYARIPQNMEALNENTGTIFRRGNSGPF